MFSSKKDAGEGMKKKGESEKEREIYKLQTGAERGTKREKIDKAPSSGERPNFTCKQEYIKITSKVILAIQPKLKQKMERRTK